MRSAMSRFGLAPEYEVDHSDDAARGARPAPGDWLETAQGACVPTMSLRLVVAHEGEAFDLSEGPTAET
jgi:hypothetical protein